MALAKVKKIDKEDTGATPDPTQTEIVFEDIESLALNFLNSRQDILILQTRNSDDNNSWHAKEISRHAVYKLALTMTRNRTIATVIGIEPETLLKHFKKEIELGRAVTKSKVQAISTNEAMNSRNVVDRIFWLKNYGNMSDNGLTDTDDEEGEANFKVSKPAMPTFKPVSNDAIDDMLQVIESGEDQ